MNKMSEFFLQLFDDHNELYSLVIEDDGKVAYAYLRQEENIIGDVWLYNQLPSPVKVNWDDSSNMPFLNPKEYIKESIHPITDKDNIELNWIFDDTETLQEVNVYINSKLIAKLSPKACPGWSKLVTKNGPLAKVYIDSKP